MEKKKYEKPQVCVIEVELHGIMTTLSVGETTGTALVKRRDTLSDGEENDVFSSEESSAFGEMDVFNLQE